MEILVKSRYFIGPVILGGYISIAPFEILLLSLLFILPFALWMEWRRTNIDKFYPIGVARILTVLAIVAAAVYAPYKYEDMKVETSNADYLTGGKIALLKFNDHVSFTFPSGIKKEQLNLPNGTKSIRELISIIEESTGLQANIGYCGNMVTILGGAFPIGGVHLNYVTQQEN